MCLFNGFYVYVISILLIYINVFVQCFFFDGVFLCIWFLSWLMYIYCISEIGLPLLFTRLIVLACVLHGLPIEDMWWLCS